MTVLLGLFFLNNLGLSTSLLGSRRALGDLGSSGVGARADLGLVLRSLGLGSLRGFGDRRGRSGGVNVRRHGTPLLLDLTKAGCGCLAIGETGLGSNDLPIDL
jgi:hypothetical protein